MKQEHRQAFRTWFMEGFEKEDFAEMYADEIVKLIPDLSVEIATSWGKNFYDQLLTSNVRIRTESDKSPTQNNTIEIFGHGKAGYHNIVNSNKTEKITAPQLIQRLIQKGLINDNTRLKLTACHGAQGVHVKNLPLTMNYIKSLFRKGELQKYLNQDSEKSLLFAVKSEVSKQLPTHNAPILAYFGEMNSVLLDDVYHMNGTVKMAHSVSVYDQSGTEVYLNRHQMAHIIN